MTTSSIQSVRSDPNVRSMPDWLWPLLGAEGPWQGERMVGSQAFSVRDGIPRSGLLLSQAQAQTEETFGSTASLKRMRDWLVERYGDVNQATWLADHGPRPILLDAGCGAGMSALELFAGVLPNLRYLGVDVSEAVDVAADRFAEHGFEGAFLQADISDLPLPERSVDLIFSEGVLHHTNSTRDALLALTRLLKPGGRFLFYVYRKKGPVREFTDDHIRAQLQSMTPQQAWEAVEPLTQLGITLGELNATVDIPRPIDILGIPAGPIDVQRLFYWHVAKAFYRPELSYDEMNHINYDWYAPANAHRQSPEEVRAWCAETDLTIEREVIEEAGITIVARKAAG
jgi:arsenite methyltransferase